MNKSELIDQIASKADISKQTASLALDSFIDGLKENLNKGAEVRIGGLGTWCVADRKATEGRNPRTGEKISIPAHKVVKFKASKELRECVN
ncbi:HU family DNA-binding protein [Tenacibaculum sp. C7A-26P2]|uniref:HU family DNA-binding protein n=1 Tax=Tenacibaculum sp. C7A-26P2 TaxID=3447504 RepID=UPI003F861282